MKETARQKKKKQARGVTGGSDTPKGRTPALELFQKESDSGSHRVRSRMEELRLDFIAYTLGSSGSPEDLLKLKQLQELGAKAEEVPFFYDRSAGVKLAGADAIIVYLDQQYGTPETEQADFPPLEIARRLEERLRSRSEELRWAMRESMERAERLGSDAVETWKSARQTFKLLSDVLTGRERTGTSTGSATQSPNQPGLRAEAPTEPTSKSKRERSGS